MFSAFSSFLGTGYQSSKESKGAFYTTMISAITNIIINLVFIKIIGLQAAAVSTFIAYLVLFIVRFFDTKKYFEMDVNWKKFISLSICAIAFITVYTLNKNTVVQIILSVTSLLIFFALNKFFIVNATKKIVHKLLGKKRENT